MCSMWLSHTLFLLLTLLVVRSEKMARQEGVEVLRKEYCDIMLVGVTGQGKSTMADKLLIANPDNVSYALLDKLNMRQSDER